LVDQRREKNRCDNGWENRLNVIANPNAKNHETDFTQQAHSYCAQADFS
jgi:hypothetical protein